MNCMPFAYFFATLRALPGCSMGIADTPINAAPGQIREQSVSIIDGQIERSGATAAQSFRFTCAIPMVISNYLNEENNA
jgi:hypothetical protein